MSLSEVRESQWSQLTELIAERMGLHFPRERWGDLQRGLAGAAQELGFEDAAACVTCLLSAPPTKAQLQVLASHLTIGESYFFRDRQTLEAFADNILPELIRARRGRDQRLRIWSAACCTGEEPYSLAILLHQRLPDLREWLAWPSCTAALWGWRAGRGPVAASACGCPTAKLRRLCRVAGRRPRARPYPRPRCRLRW